MSLILLVISQHHLLKSEVRGMELVVDLVVGIHILVVQESAGSTRVRFVPSKRK